jgi:hypothetical protein
VAFVLWKALLKTTSLFNWRGSAICIFSHGKRNSSNQLRLLQLFKVISWIVSYLALLFRDQPPLDLSIYFMFLREHSVFKPPRIKRNILLQIPYLKNQQILEKFLLHFDTAFTFGAIVCCQILKVF